MCFSCVCMCVCVCACVCVCLRSNQSTSKKPHYVTDLIVCTPLSAMGVGGGFGLQPNFEKGEA